MTIEQLMEQLAATGWRISGIRDVQAFNDHVGEPGWQAAARKPGTFLYANADGALLTDALSALIAKIEAAS